MPRDILIFSTGDWDNPFWTNKQHTARLFAEKGYRVLYVDSLGLRRPTLHGRDLWRIVRRLWKALPFPRQVRKNVWRISPLVLPAHSNPKIRAFNDRLLRRTILWHMKLLGLRRPIIWTYNPTIAELCESLPNSGLVYHCVDDLSAAPGIDPTLIEEGERRLGAAAALCFTTAPRLRDKMSGLFPKVVYEPNVCDQRLFNTARHKLAEPEVLHGIPGPRLLFVGALSAYKVDFKLIKAVAEQLPEIHWVLAGATGEGQPGSCLPPQLPNLHLAGPQPYRQLPALMSNCAVAVLPAPHNAYTASMFPMKFFEYLAAGLPVISTRLPALSEFEELFFPADTADEFVAAIKAVLRGERKDGAAIDAACAKHSWTARFDRMEQHLLAELEAANPFFSART